MFNKKLKPGINDRDLKNHGYDIVHDKDVRAIKRTSEGNVFIDHLGNVMSFNESIVDKDLVEK